MAAFRRPVPAPVKRAKKMKTKLALIVLATAFALPAWAGGPVSDLAEISGLSERKVQMLIGNRTAFAEYRYTYDRSLETLVAAIGTVNYERLLDGERVVIRNTDGRELAVQLRGGKLHYAL